MHDKRLLVPIFIVAGLCLTIMSAHAGDAELLREFNSSSFIKDAAPSAKSRALMQSINDEHRRSLVVEKNAADNIFLANQYLSLEQFPVSTTAEGTLELTRARSIYDDETVIRFATKNGWHYVEAPEITTYRGKIRGDDGSNVFVSYINGKILASIYNGAGERYLLTSMGTDAKSNSEHVLIDERGNTLDQDGNPVEFECGNSTAEFTASPEKSISAESLESVSFDTLLEATLEVEADTRLYVAFGRNPDAQLEYLVQLYANISNLYEQELNITLKPNFTIFLDDNDGFASPYTSTSIGNLLNEFSNYWSARKGHISRTLAQLLTGPDGTSTGGIAWLNGLCSRNRGYNVCGLRRGASLPRLEYHWDMMVIAHELGHNFGSPHTHVCNYPGVGAPIDTCVTRPGTGDACRHSSTTQRKLVPGTIMSYCHIGNPNGSQLVFSPPVAAVIRAGAENASVGPAACMQQPENPTVLLQHPVGGSQQIVAAGSELEVRWTTAFVDLVVLEYSLDGGDTWLSATDKNPLPASDQRFNWQVPNVSTKSAAFRVSDASEPALYDETLALFEIKAPGLDVSNPVGGERYPQRTEITIRWSSSLLESVRVEFSDDGGAEWDEVTVIDANLGFFDWALPAIETEEAIVRVVNIGANELIAESGEFAIGVPRLNVTFPRSGWTLWRGSTREIRWDADFINRVNIEFSPDNGESWDRLRSIYTASAGFFEWFIDPDTTPITSEALVRVVETVSGGIVSLSEPFAITGDGVVSVGDPDEAHGIRILSIDPNPASDVARIRFSLDASANDVEIVVRDVRGTIALRSIIANASTGVQVEELSTSGLAQGMYYLTLKIGDQTVNAPLTIIR